MRSTLLVVLLLAATSLQAQRVTFDEGYALVFPKDRDGFYVRSLRVVGDSVYCFSPEIRAYAKSDIRKILVRRQKPSINAIGIGALIGVYAMHYAIGQATNQPGAFLSYTAYGENDNSALIWTTLLGLGVGGGIGYLFNNTPAYGQLTPYVFAGNQELIDEQWETFASEVGGMLAMPKFHITVSAGDVSTPTGTGYRRMLESKGFNHFNESYYGGSFFSFDQSSVERATSFNMLRKMELEYSITDNIRAGVTFSWLSEPALYARKGEDIFNSTDEIYQFLQKLEGHGYYATGAYQYYLTPNRNFSVNAKVGAGMAQMHHEIHAEYQRNSNDSPTEKDIRDDKQYFSFFGSVGANFDLYRNFSLGVTANYFYGGKTTMSDIFIIDVPPMDVTYSTMDIGVSLGVHF